MSQFTWPMRIGAKPRDGGSIYVHKAHNEAELAVHRVLRAHCNGYDVEHRMVVPDA